MEQASRPRGLVSPNRNPDTYTCTDCIKIARRRDTVRTSGNRMKNTRTVPRNGVRRMSGIPPVAVISGTVQSREMAEIIQGGPARTYALPNTAASVFTFAFKDRKSLVSVKFNAWLQTLGYWCFRGSGIKKLSLPAGVREMGTCAFFECARLESADLSAARSLDALPKSAFNGCGRLGRVALGEGLRTVGEFCFKGTALGEVSLPRSVTRIECFAFQGCVNLRRLRLESDGGLREIWACAFEGSGIEEFVAPASLRELGNFAFSGCRSLRRADFSSCSFQLGDGVFRNSGLAEVVLPRALRTIGERAFQNCANLRSLALEGCTALEEVGRGAFFGSGLETFAAPPSLRKVGDLAFGSCSALGELELCGGVRELGWLCFWGTRAGHMALPAAMGFGPERLGIGQGDSRVLRLPDGLQEVGEDWLRDGLVEEVFVPASVRSLGKCAFYRCGRLGSVVFAPGSCLERIGDSCFEGCGLREVVVPASVQRIGCAAFC